MQETFGTLVFAAGAKKIRNRVGMGSHAGLTARISSLGSEEEQSGSVLQRHGSVSIQPGIDRPWEGPTPPPSRRW